MTLPPGLRLYRAGAGLLGPLARPVLADRARRGKEDRARLGERRGTAGRPRPDGPLVWIHAASVGESLVGLAVADALQEAREDVWVLMTSGTGTSADIIARRCGPARMHQYVPIDQPGWARRFVEHWTPDLAVFIESELWPNLILETNRTGARLALVNARMNERSLVGWARFPESAAWLLACFDWIGAADARTAEGLGRLTAMPIERPGNLKLEAAAAPPDPEALTAAREAVGERPVWVAASTHQGEEEVLIAAHRLLRQSLPDALMILAPRHPERGLAVASILEEAKVSHARRGAGDSPERSDEVWLADTLGEMPLWYALSPVAFIAGSLKPGIGGHNPVEATRAGAAVVTGPHAESFADVFAAYDRETARLVAETPEDIAAAILKARGDADLVASAERALTGMSGGAMETTTQALLDLLDAPRAPAEL